MSDVIEQFLRQLQHPLIAGIDLSLDRMVRLLSLLRNPQKRLPPVIHVAGTNGKGSLIAYLHAIFEAAGYRVHRYTSPHLVHFRERILLQGKEIDNANIEKIFRYISPYLQQQVTFFEAITVAAFVAFSEKPADILLLETGLGGLLDATNVIEKPLLTAITPIAFDHTEFLGNTIEKIAGEKAGIIKRGVPCIVGRQDFPEVLPLLEEKAKSLAAPLFRLGQEWRVENHRYISSTKNIELMPALAGEHQYDNAATAVACIEQIPQFNISDEHIKIGLAKAVWPARLQHLTTHPYCNLLPPEMELWLDGGHNPQGGQVLGKWLEQQSKNKKIYLVCGMIKGKDMKEFLRYLAPYSEFLCSVIIREEANSQPAQAVAEAAQDVGIKAQATASVEKALQTVIDHAKTNGNKPAIICICGSLYLAGKVLEVEK
jgi:dihydrofolate synthase/folylpolyglutamate synthase